MKPLHVALAIAVPLIWGFGFTLAKFALGDLPPIFLVACRYAITALAFVWFVPIPRDKLGRIALIAALGAALPYALTYNGLAEIDVSTVAFLTQLEIPIAALIAAVFLGERIGTQRVVGMALAFAGLMVIFGEPKLQENWIPPLLVLAGGTAWAAGQVLVRSLGPVGAFSLLAWLGVFATPILFSASLVFESGHAQAIARASWQSWAAVLYLGVVMNGVGYALWYFLLARHPVNHVIAFQLLLPVASVAGGALLLGERMTWPVIVGGGIVVAGVAFVTVDWAELLGGRKSPKKGGARV